MMKKDKQKQIEILQDFFLTKKDLSFSEIDWKNIFSWINNLDIKSELKSMSDLYNLKSITLFSFSGDIVSYVNERANWNEYKNQFNTYSNKWIIEKNKTSFTVGLKIKNIKNNNFFIVIKGENKAILFKNINTIYNIFKLISLGFKEGQSDKENIVKIDFKKLEFPTIQKEKNHIIRTSDCTIHLPQIRDILSQLGLNSVTLNPADLNFKDCDNNIFIINNIQNWDNLQEDFLLELRKLKSKGMTPTLVFCLDVDPLYLYQKGKITEEIFNILFDCQFHEYSLSPIVESSIDENKIVDIFHTVWDLEEKKVA